MPQLWVLLLYAHILDAFDKAGPRSSRRQRHRLLDTAYDSLKFTNITFDQFTSLISIFNPSRQFPF